MGVFRKDPVQYESARVLPFNTHRALTAAATKINLRDRTTVELLSKRRANSTWQQDAWEYYDAIGEIKYAYKLFTNVLSRVRLYAAYIEDDDSSPISIKDSDLDDAVKDAAEAAMRKVFSGANQASILRKAGINMLVAGECYLVKLPAKIGVRDKEMWRIISIDELVTRNGKYYLKPEKDMRIQDQEELPQGTFLGRIWNEHARYSDEPDSAMKALVDLCDELFLFSRAARAAARSRLNAGALLIPDTLSVSVDQVEDSPEDLEPGADLNVPIENDSEDDEFEEELIDAVTTPIADEGSAAAVVPLIIRGPREDLKEVRHIKFERTIDPQLAQRAERALERILQGIDLPKDIVTGLANIKYSNAVQIEESLYTAHIEPLVLLLCDVFRTIYLEPELAKVVDPATLDRIVIWYDPSAIMTAPDKSSAASIGHDKVALSDEAWRRYNGFTEADAPSDEEVARRLAIQRGSLSEEVTTAIFMQIFPEILKAARAQSIADSPSPLSPAVQDVLDGAPRPPDVPGQEGQTPPAAGDGALPPIVQDGNGQDTPPVSGP